MAFEIFTEGFSFLNLISIVAFFTTVGLFFCGLPICRQIWKRKDTTEIAAAPFLMGILGGVCWMTYGYLKQDSTVLVVTSCQVVLYSTYTVFYWFMTQRKCAISLKVGAILSLCGGIVSMVYFFGKAVYHPLGILCMTLNAADFAAPLAGLGTVIRRRATSTLPLPLCVANFLVSTEWFIYGLLKGDIYLITPNGIGSVLALSQVILFLVLPRKPGQRSPICRLLRICSTEKVVDIETAVVVDDASSDGVYAITQKGSVKKSGEKECSWPSRVISNLEHELDNVISRVTPHDQFGYTHDFSADSESDVLERVRSEEKEHRDRCNSLRQPEPRPILARAASSPDLSN